MRGPCRTGPRGWWRWTSFCRVWQLLFVAAQEAFAAGLNNLPANARGGAVAGALPLANVVADAVAGPGASVPSNGDVSPSPHTSAKQSLSAHKCVYCWRTRGFLVGAQVFSLSAYTSVPCRRTSVITVGQAAPNWSTNVFTVGARKCSS